MDTTKKIEIDADVHISDDDLALAKEIVMEAIRNVSTCYWADIHDENNGRVSLKAVSAAISSLIKQRVIRQKEDDIEHDWEYRFV